MDNDYDEMIELALAEVANKYGEDSPEWWAACAFYGV